MAIYRQQLSDGYHWLIEALEDSLGYPRETDLLDNLSTDINAFLLQYDPSGRLVDLPTASFTDTELDALHQFLCNWACKNMPVEWVESYKKGGNKFLPPIKIPDNEKPSRASLLEYDSDDSL